MLAPDVPEFAVDVAQDIANLKANAYTEGVAIVSRFFDSIEETNVYINFDGFRELALPAEDVADSMKRLIGNDAKTFTEDEIFDYLQTLNREEAILYLITSKYGNGINIIDTNFATCVFGLLGKSGYVKIKTKGYLEPEWNPETRVEMGSQDPEWDPEEDDEFDDECEDLEEDWDFEF